MTNSTGPTVSVVIPAYNSAHSLAHTIASALAQTLPPLEIIVVDDGSADATAEIAERFGPPVLAIRKPNGGPASARNLGIQRSRGTWIALLDADDQWTPDKLERQLGYTDDLTVGLVHTLTSFQPNEPPRELDFAALWQRNHIVNSTVLVRREAILGLGGFDEARDLISTEDYNLWLRLAAAGWRILLCPEPLAHYTRGVGISSDTPRFLKASLYNAHALGESLRLPRPLVDAKVAAIHFEFGLGALYRRDMAAARQHLLRSARLVPRARCLALLAVACCPPVLLDLKRHLGRLRTGRRPPGIPATADALIERLVAMLFPPPAPEGVRMTFRNLAEQAIGQGLAAAHHEGEILGAAQRLAWAGYDAPPARHRLPAAEAAVLQRVRRCPPAELLAIVAALARHAAPPRPAAMGLDALAASFAASGLAARLPPLAAAQDARTPLAYYLALLMQQRRSPLERPAAAAAVAAVLCRMIGDIDAALADFREAAEDADLGYLVMLAEEVSARCPQLWLDALALATPPGLAVPAGPMPQGEA